MMPIEIIGRITPTQQSESLGMSFAGQVDPDYTLRFARAHEEADFDRVLLEYASFMPDNLQIAAYVAAHTEKLGFLVAHRPGVVSPTVAARTYATLDQFSGGRVALHTITGNDDVELRRDGDYVTDKADRYARTREYLQIVKLAWTAEEPFGYEGRFYRIEGYLPTIKPLQSPRIPVYFGGSSSLAYEVGSSEADVYALFAQPLDQIKEEIDRIAVCAREAGRAEPPGISVSFRPIIGATEEEAWERAHQILSDTKERAAGNSQLMGALNSAAPSSGSARQLRAAERGERHDRALWTSIAAATGAGGGNSTALVGTAETVADALLDYVDLGVTTLLIRGFDPLEDATEFGRELIPRVRAGVAERERDGVLIGRRAERAS